MVVCNDFSCLFCFFRIPTVPVKNLNDSSTVLPALAGKREKDILTALVSVKSNDL